jgi:hypothetical protein
MNKSLIMVFMVGVLILAACAPSPPVEEPAPIPDPTATEPPSPEPTPPEPPSPEATATDLPSPEATPTQPDALSLEEAAEAVVNALAEKDLETVAGYVHPEMGVRLSPYAYVEDAHLVFMAEELPELIGSDEVFVWGAFDGTGDPIELTFDAYYERFLYSADFANPESMAVDGQLGHGNSINNIPDYYPGSSFVEYHFSGFEAQYEGLDWVSLRLVFIQENDTWFLVGMVNDQWTI